MPTVRILIADDHEIVRRGLRLLIASRPDWQVCGEAEDGDEAINKAKQLHPDLILFHVATNQAGGPLDSPLKLDFATIVQTSAERTNRRKPCLLQPIMTC